MAKKKLTLGMAAAAAAGTAVYVAKKSQDRRIRTAHHRTTSGIRQILVGH